MGYSVYRQEHGTQTSAMEQFNVLRKTLHSRPPLPTKKSVLFLTAKINGGDAEKRIQKGRMKGSKLDQSGNREWPVTNIIISNRAGIHRKPGVIQESRWAWQNSKVFGKPGINPPSPGFRTRIPNKLTGQS